MTAKLFFETPRSKSAIADPSPSTMLFLVFSNRIDSQASLFSDFEYSFNAFICAMVNGVNAASLPPTKKASAISACNQAKPFNNECIAVEQVTE